MQYRNLGRTGYKMSRIAFGSLTMGPLGADLPVEEANRLLSAALDKGINFIDTAQHYRNYPHIAGAIFGRTENLIIASRSFADTYEEMAYAVEEARIALRRNRLEIFMLHEVRDEEDFRRRAGAWQYLQDAKACGIIGAIGISTHSAVMASFAAQLPELDVIHALINYRGIGILDGGLAKMEKALRQAVFAGKGVYAMKAIGGGALMQDAKAALKWAFSIDYLSGIAIGCKDLAELDTDIAWLEGRESPSAGQVLLLQRNLVFDKEPRCHGCGRCVARCAQGALILDAQNQAIWQKDLCLFCGYCIGECPWFCLS
ncbi:MAG: aldo/keto reductase, partial [Clostridiales bacterium]